MSARCTVRIAPSSRPAAIASASLRRQRSSSFRSGRYVTTLICSEEGSTWRRVGDGRAAAPVRIEVSRCARIVCETPSKVNPNHGRAILVHFTPGSHDRIFRKLPIRCAASSPAAVPSPESGWCCPPRRRAAPLPRPASISRSSTASTAASTSPRSKHRSPPARRAAHRRSCVRPVPTPSSCSARSTSAPTASWCRRSPTRTLPCAR